MEILVEIYPYWKTSVKRWFIESYNCWRSVCWTLNRILLHYTSTLSVFLRHTLQNSTGYILLFYLVNYFSHSQLNVSNPLVVDRSPCEFVEFRSRTRSHLYHECLKEQSHKRFTHLGNIHHYLLIGIDFQTLFYINSIVLSTFHEV